MDQKTPLLGNLPDDVQSVFRLMMEQVLIIQVMDAGGTLDVPVSRVDNDTKGVRMNFEVVETDAGAVLRFSVPSA